MGLLDLPGPIFSAIDGALGAFLPAFPRLLLWGLFAGWLTMLLYRRISNQEKIGALKAEQKQQQQRIAEFDGEFTELMPLIRSTLGTGFRQLGLALGPALLATLPILFLVVWVAGRFGYEMPPPGATVTVKVTPADAPLRIEPPTAIAGDDSRRAIAWPRPGGQVVLLEDGTPLLVLPPPEPVPVIHGKRWWNLLMANPIGYLPGDAAADLIELGLPEQQIIGFGAAWMRGWMFSFFGSFLLASLAFKFILKID